MAAPRSCHSFCFWWCCYFHLKMTPRVHGFSPCGPVDAFVLLAAPFVGRSRAGRAFSRMPGFVPGGAVEIAAFSWQPVWLPFALLPFNESGRSALNSFGLLGFPCPRCDEASLCRAVFEALAFPQAPSDFFVLLASGCRRLFSCLLLLPFWLLAVMVALEPSLLCAGSLNQGGFGTCSRVRPSAAAPLA